MNYPFTVLVLSLTLGACVDDGASSNNRSPGQVLESVRQYDIRHGSQTMPDMDNDVINTFHFDKNGKFEFSVSQNNDTARNSSAYDLATRNDTLSVDKLGSYPAYKVIKANRKYDEIGNLVFYSEAYIYDSTIDTTYDFYFVNEYWDGKITGKYPNAL